jgi:thiamine biosynthesis protein ThiS
MGTKRLGEMVAREEALEIRVNGERRKVNAPLTVGNLLESLRIKPQAVVVERNLNIVARSEVDREPVEEGDTIEIIRLVGGG